MSDKLVSILIPVYNRENLIGKCIESALAQTYSNFEIIVVDNKSTDNTWEICQKYADKFANVKVYQNSQNIGPVLNWVECVKKANGEFGKILFSDDLIYGTYLEKTVSMLTDDVGFVFSNIEIGTNKGLGNAAYNYLTGSGTVKSEKFINDVVAGDFGLVSPGAAIFRIKDLKKNILHEDGSIKSPSIIDFNSHGAGPDLLVYLLTCQDYPKVAYMDEVLGLFRVHSGSLTVADSKRNHYYAKCYAQAKIFFCEKYNCCTECIDKLLTLMWINEIRSKGKIVFFRNFITQYTYDRDRYKICYSLIGRKILSKIIRMITNGK